MREFAYTERPKTQNVQGAGIATAYAVSRGRETAECKTVAEY